MSAFDTLRLHGAAADWRAVFSAVRPGDSAGFWCCYNNYLQSRAWGEKRAARIEADGCKCAACGLIAAATVLQVHHLNYRNVGNESAEDLVTLCRCCHAIHHGHGEELSRGSGLTIAEHVRMFLWRLSAI